MKKNLLQNFGLFEVIFILVVFFDAFIINTFPVLRLISNPLIVATLIIFYKSSVDTDYEWKMLIALFFSLVGDMMLMFEHPLFFKYGLICYSITHIGYALTITKMIDKLNINNWIGLVLTSIYYILAVILILPKTAQFWPFILTYSFAQFIMCLVVMMQNKNNYIVLGAFIFVISDLLLAGYKFNLLIIEYPIIIMLTYAMAQYLIVKGITYQKNSEKYN